MYLSQELYLINPFEAKFDITATFFFIFIGLIGCLTNIVILQILDLPHKFDKLITSIEIMTWLCRPNVASMTVSCLVKGPSTNPRP